MERLVRTRRTVRTVPAALVASPAAFTLAPANAGQAVPAVSGIRANVPQCSTASGRFFRRNGQYPSCSGGVLDLSLGAALPGPC
jgi:hypothetical protein